MNVLKMLYNYRYNYESLWFPWNQHSSHRFIEKTFKNVFQLQLRKSYKFHRWTWFLKRFSTKLYLHKRYLYKWKHRFIYYNSLATEHESQQWNQTEILAKHKQLAAYWLPDRLDMVFCEPVFSLLPSMLLILQAARLLMHVGYLYLIPGEI